jgi:hypothetical protein
MARIRTAAEGHAEQLVEALRANVARLEADYGALQRLLEEVAGAIGDLCQRVNGPHAERRPYDDLASGGPAEEGQA